MILIWVDDMRRNQKPQGIPTKFTIGEKIAQVITNLRDEHELQINKSCLYLGMEKIEYEYDNINENTDVFGINFTREAAAEAIFEYATQININQNVLLMVDVFDENDQRVLSHHIFELVNARNTRIRPKIFAIFYSRSISALHGENEIIENNRIKKMHIDWDSPKSIASEMKRIITQMRIV